jgi:hypothetical protein
MSFIQKAQQAGSAVSSSLHSLQKGFSSLLSNARSVKHVETAHSSETTKTGQVYAGYSFAFHPSATVHSVGVDTKTSFTQSAKDLWSKFTPKSSGVGEEFCVDEAEEPYSSASQNSETQNMGTIDTKSSFREKATGVWCQFRQHLNSFPLGFISTT